MDLAAAAAQHQQLHQNYSRQESESLESMIINSKSPEDSNNNNNQESDQKKLRPPETEPQHCPRCQSTNTKFCYYNNYSLAQPRYFCKACRRYWTKGGTLRNVPVGGGCRKSAKRAASNSPSQFLKRPHTSENFLTSPPSSHNPVFSGLLGYTGGMMANSNFSDLYSGVNNFMGHHHSAMSFLQDPQYGNGDLGFMFPSIPCNYDEIGAGNSNSGSGISDDVTALVPYGDVTPVKQETIENAAFWEHPWQNSLTGGEIEPIRENWNGLIGNYSVLGLLNSQSF